MRITALFVLTVALTAAAPAVAQVDAEDTDASDPLSDARAARLIGNHLRAAALASKASSGETGRQKGYAALFEGLARLDGGQPSKALTALETAEPLLPHLSDRIALARGAALVALGRHDEAIESFSKARKTASLEIVAMRADVDKVRAMLDAVAKSDIQRAAQLLVRYPQLPEAQEIDFKVARSYEKRGRKAAAYVRYRKLFLEHPHTFAGEHSGERLEELARGGQRVAKIRSTEHLGRIRKLISEREYDAAEREIVSLLAGAKGSVRHMFQLELAVVSFRRNELDRSRRLLSELRSERGPVGPWPERCEIQSGHTRGAIKRVLKGKAATKRTPPWVLVRVAEIHLDAGEYEKARRVLSFVKMSQATGFMAQYLPWIAMKRGDYDAAIPGLSLYKEQRWSRGRRAYWVGRMHQKAGRPCEARAFYESAIRASPHGYYALWSRKRLGQLRDEVSEAQAAEGATPLRCPAPESDGDEETTVAWTDPDPLMLWKIGPRQPEPTETEGLEAFNALIKSNGKALPWLERARDLWLSGDVVAAGEELRHVLWLTRGQLAPTVGLPRLWGGRAPVRVAGWRRARFDETESEAYLTATRVIGEHGLAIRADRPDWGDTEAWHPLAFEPMVRSAAKQHGLQPELMWSIMRIESYFNRHAISHAQALGLMQILPRTGRLIAKRRNIEDFEVADLLSPQRGLDFSGWYLKALSDRFHGQPQLMIAAYNGGPHNVAKWILRRSDTDRPLPMDEFLEEIPFSETFRYVRRVTASLAAYHALAGLPPPDLPEHVNRDVAGGVNF